LQRDAVFVTTKFMPGHDVPKSDDVYAQLRRSLPRLQPETPQDEAYIDLMLIHAPRPNAEARTAEWAALAKGAKEGWLRSIGVSNFGVAHLKALPGPVPAVNQIELHPWCQQRDIVAYCKEKGIAVQAYCPLVRAQRAEDPVLTRIAKKYGKTWAQILIRWSLQKGYSPQVKSVNEWRIQENAEVYDFELADEDMAELDDCDMGAEGACSWNPVDTP
jgi:diketogulonate reductase-like aldo/keto reductase